MDLTPAERGFFVALEGGEGSGKSTQSRYLSEWLDTGGRRHLLTRQPGGTEVGRTLRSILLDPATGVLSPRTEALIYLADKAEHVDTVLRPALDDGAVVVTDRYVESMLAYQGAGRDLPTAELTSIAAWATGNLVPDLTIVLDMDPRLGLARAGTPDRMEAEPLEFHERVREHFRAAAAVAPERHIVISADQSPEAIHAQIRAVLAEHVGVRA